MPNMTFVADAKNSTLLQYAATTNPFPLQASPPAPADPAVGEIDIAVSNGSEAPIYCQSITFRFPVGDNAKDLVSTGNAGAVLVAATPSKSWEINPGPAPGEFIATPCTVDDQEITAGGLLFQFYNIKVNEEVGTLTFSTEESASLDGATWENRSGDYQLAKFPYGFFMRDLGANAVQVADGDPVTLTWKASENATYRILYGSATPVDVTNCGGQWTTPHPPGIHDDTTFLLEGTVVVDNLPVVHYLSVTVTVSNPDIAATSLSVAQQTTLSGATNVGSPSAPAPLSVIGGATLDAASVSGALTVNGLLAVHGGVSGRLLDAITPGIAPGVYTAVTDGFLMGWCSGFGLDWSAKCYGWVDAWTGWMHGYAMGGNVIAWLDSDGHFTQANNAGSFLLPLEAGVTYNVRWQPGPTADIQPGYGFAFISLGGANGDDATRRIGDLDPDASPPASSGPGRA